MLATVSLGAENQAFITFDDSETLEDYSMM
jgi:hypothetical protein